jgi:hypothetical protein
MSYVEPESITWAMAPIRCQCYGVPKITISVKFSSVCAMKPYFGSGVGRSGPTVCSVSWPNSDRTTSIDWQSVLKCLWNQRRGCEGGGFSFLICVRISPGTHPSYREIHSLLGSRATGSTKRSRPVLDSGGNTFPFTTNKVRDSVLYLSYNHARPRLLRGISAYISTKNS